MLRHGMFINSVDYTQTKKSCENKRGIIEKYSSNKEIRIRKGVGEMKMTKIHHINL